MKLSEATLARQYEAGPLVAYHEAGHALVGHVLGHQVERLHVSFARDSGESRFTRPIYDPEHRALALLAGERAERHCYSWLDGFERLHSGSDDRQGARLALEELPGWTPEELLERVDDLLLWHHRALERLARKLDDVRILDGAAVAELLG